MRNRRTLLAWAAAAVCLAAAGAAHAAVTYTWQTTDGLWSDANNWSPAGGPPASADRANFNTAAGPATIDLGGGMQTLDYLYVYNNYNTGTGNNWIFSNGTLSVNTINVPWGGGNTTDAAVFNCLIAPNAGDLTISSGNNPSFNGGFSSGSYAINASTGNGAGFTVNTTASPLYTGTVTITESASHSDRVDFTVADAMGRGTMYLSRAGGDGSGYRFMAADAFQGVQLNVGSTDPAKGIVTRVQLTATGAVNAPISVVEGTLEYSAANALAGSNTITMNATGGQTALVKLGGNAFGSNQFNLSGDSGISINTAANTLTRGTNMTLGENAVLATGSSGKRAAFQNLGTAADLFFGIDASFAENVTIGTGTPYKGISSTKSDYSFQPGTGVTTTITVADNTPDIYLQSLSMSITPGTTNGLTVGNGATAGGVTIDKGTNAAINANVRRGVVTLNDTSNSFAGVTWIVNNGAILSAAASGAFVDSTAVTVQSGGTLVAKTTDGISLAPTFQGGSRLWAGLAAGYTGSPTLDLTASGAILDIRNATALSGTQTILTGAGTVIRLAASSVVLPTSGAEVPSPAATYELISTTQASASVAALLLDGGGYTNDATSRTEASTNRAVNFVNGATLSATTGTTFTLGELIGGTGTLTVGSTSPIDGLDKQGTIVLQNAGNSLAAVDVAAGVLRVDSSVARLGGATGLNVADSAKLWFNFTNPSLTSVAFSGGGTVQIGNGTSTLTLVGGDVGPGNSPGVLTIDGNLTISDTAMFILTIDVNGGSLLPGVGFDQLAVETLTSTGSADELANIDLVVDIHGAAGIAPTDQLPFLTTTNTLSGLFKSVTVNGGTADVVVTGNGAYLTNVVPEPATLVLLGLGFLPLVLRRKRR